MKPTSTESQTPALVATGVTKSYAGTTVVDNVSLAIPSGGLTVITGPSGSGKTTLLNILSAIDTPDSGKVKAGSIKVTKLKAAKRDAYRATTGHIFQRSGLIAGLTAGDNIRAIHALNGTPIDEAWLTHLLDRLGVAQLVDAPATQLSGGQAQRIALIRALAHHPRIVFADEPTASLDTTSKKEVHEVLREVAREGGTTVILVSHDAISTQYADIVATMRDGAISNVGAPVIEDPPSRHSAISPQQSWRKRRDRG